MLRNGIRVTGRHPIAKGRLDLADPAGAPQTASQERRANREGSAHPVRRVLEDHAAAGGDLQAAGSEEKQLGVGLDPGDVVASDDHVQQVADLVTAEPALDPAARAARGHRPGQAPGLRVAEERLDPREQRLGLAQPVRGGPDLALELLPGQGLPHQRLEVGVGVEATVGAEGVLPLVEAQGLPATLVGALPGLVDRRFGVDDETVEVQDDGVDAQRYLVRWSIVRSQLLTAASRSYTSGRSSLKKACFVPG